MPPRYEVRHKGPAIICGGAPSVFEDLEKARQFRPNAVLLGANLAAGLFLEIEHIWTQHNNFAQLLKEQIGRPIKVHGRSNIMGQVDYVWPELAFHKGSSGLVGALWAKAMGFDEVIMAGIPLSTSELGHSKEYQTIAKNSTFYTASSIELYQVFARKYKEEGKTQGIYSMSGYTKQVFGPPPGLED
jgi:hypothetical protein